MKLKAAISDNLSEELVKKLNGIRQQILVQVLVPHLKVPEDWGPTQFFVQNCDVCDAKTHGMFVHVTLSGVSLTDDRADNDFSRARDEIEGIYGEVIAEHLPKGETCEITVIIMLDKPLRNGDSIVEEDEPANIEGTLEE